MSLVENINKRKRAGTSRSKSKSTISDEAYNDMKNNWKKNGGLKNKTMKLKKKKNGGELGKLSIKAGQDNNPKVTRADIIAGATMGKSKKKMGGKKKMYGGSAMKPKKKGMGGTKMMKYKTGGFTLEPKTPNLDDL